MHNQIDNDFRSSVEEENKVDDRDLKDQSPQISNEEDINNNKDLKDNQTQG